MVLHTIADEEAVQFGILNLLYSVFNFRGCPKPEGCHGLWNSFKRAVSSSGALGNIIKMHLLVQSGTGCMDEWFRFREYPRSGRPTGMILQVVPSELSQIDYLGFFEFSVEI